MRIAIARISLLLPIVIGGCPDDALPAGGTGSSSRGPTSADDMTSEQTQATPPTASGDATQGMTADGSSSGSSSTGSGPDSTGVPGTTGEPRPLSFTVVTFNTGTTTGLAHGSDGDAYGSDEADLSDQYYGDGLAWQVNVDLTAAFFADLQPDIVAFQELFYSGECPDIPPSAYPGFVCETWQPGDPTVVQQVLGPGYQIACHLGRPDKCLAVRQDFGTIVGCDQDFCLEGLDGPR